MRVLRYDMGRAAIEFVNRDEQTAPTMSDPVSRLPYPVSRILFCPPRWSPDTTAHRLSTELDWVMREFFRSPPVFLCTSTVKALSHRWTPTITDYSK